MPIPNTPALQSFVTPAQPGYFLLHELLGDDEKGSTVVELLAYPVVAWGHSYKASSEKWQDPVPICVEADYDRSVGLLTPNGAVVQPGVQVWDNLEAFLLSAYGCSMPVFKLG